MATGTKYLVLGQSNPAATTNVNLYTTPLLTSTIISTIVICNQSATPATFRLAIRPAGATLAAQHYLIYDSPLVGNDVQTYTCGLTMAATDCVTIQASTATVSFSAFGSELA